MVRAKAQDRGFPTDPKRAPDQVPVRSWRSRTPQGPDLGVSSLEAFHASAAPREPRPPSGGKSSCFRRARGEKVFFGLPSASSERRCCSEQTSCSGCRDRLVAPTEMRRDHEPRQVRQVVGRIGTRLSAAHFVLADRSYQTLEAKIRLRQAAGLFRSPLLFLAQGAPKQSPRTNQRR